MMGKFVFIFGLFCCSAASAHILHVGDKVFQLDAVKRTSPALGVGIDGGVFYGALYSGAAPEQTLHVRRDTSEYWLGQNCPAGKYSENCVSECTDCTIGHYCPGGAFHVPCTYGAISCNTKNNTADAPMPVGAPLNKFMTLDEVNEFIPVTDFSDWKRISCCGDQLGASLDEPETLNDASKACAAGTIGPGTYLFLTHYNNGFDENGDAVTGESRSISSVFIAVFDHPVGYASIHGNWIYQHFVDTENANYTKWTISTAPTNGAWIRNVNNTNISNLLDAIDIYTRLCVFKLK